MSRSTPTWKGSSREAKGRWGQSRTARKRNGPSGLATFAGEYVKAANQLLGAANTRTPQEILGELQARQPREGLVKDQGCRKTHPVGDRIEDRREWVRLPWLHLFIKGHQASDPNGCPRHEGDSAR